MHVCLDDSAGSDAGIPDGRDGPSGHESNLFSVQRIDGEAGLVFKLLIDERDRIARLGRALNSVKPGSCDEKGGAESVICSGSAQGNGGGGQRS